MSMQNDLNKIWTKENEEKLVQLRKEGKTFVQIGQIIGKTRYSCKNKYKYIMDKMVKEDLPEQEEVIKEVEKENEEIIKKIEQENSFLPIEPEEKPKLKLKIDIQSSLPEGFKVNKDEEIINKNLESGPEDFTFLLRDVNKNNKKEKIDLFNDVKKRVAIGPKCRRCGADAKSFIQMRNINKEHDYRHDFICEDCEKEINILLNTPKMPVRSIKNFEERKNIV